MTPINTIRTAIGTMVITQSQDDRSLLADKALEAIAQLEQPVEAVPIIEFRSKVSGLWYRSPKAAGSVDAVRRWTGAKSPEFYELPQDDPEPAPLPHACPPHIAHPAKGGGFVCSACDLRMDASAPANPLTMQDVLLHCGELNERERVAVQWVLDRLV